MLALILSTAFAFPDYKFGKKGRPAQTFYAQGRVEKKQAELRAKQEELAAAQARLDILRADTEEYDNLSQQIAAADRHATELKQKLEEFFRKRAINDQAAVQEVNTEVQEAKQEVIAAAHEAGVMPPAEATAPTPTVETAAPVIEMGAPSVSTLSETSTVPADMGTPSQSIEAIQDNAVIEEKMAAPTPTETAIPEAAQAIEVAPSTAVVEEKMDAPTPTEAAIPEAPQAVEPAPIGDIPPSQTTIAENTVPATL